MASVLNQTIVRGVAVNAQQFYASVAWEEVSYEEEEATDMNDPVIVLFSPQEYDVVAY